MDEEAPLEAEMAPDDVTPDTPVQQPFVTKEGALGLDDVINLSAIAAALTWTPAPAPDGSL